ncbi:hypothetical protein [Paenibacillus glacialis]|uniref:Uncharacterized protein n=1 Tax=Paenibacillus glacialis TaxID=494026 RepID=A0A168D8Y8_9BACL|nr:hypothetical protein [Paenibacillus glacialis]OAB33984.1 hypothetical protein PGLA_24080 [Paenibacillus glacialis]
MGERNILAYFKSPEEADRVSRKLESLRVVDMSINRFNAFQGGELNDTMHAITSDMSDGGHGATSGFDILLSVVIENNSFDQAMRIVEEAGGIV